MYSIAHHLLAYLNLIYVYPYQFHGKALTNYKFHVLNKRITLKHLLVLNFISYTLLARMIKIVLAMFNVETSQLRGFLCFGVNEISVPLIHKGSETVLNLTGLVSIFVNMKLSQHVRKVTFRASVNISAYQSIMRLLKTND